MNVGVMNTTISTGGIRRPGARLLTVLAVAALLLSPSAVWGATVGGVGSAVPTGVWPLTPVPAVVHGFDPPTSTYGAGHRGVDLSGRVGDPVRAAMAGTVTFAGSLAGRGVVVVDHGETRTTYEPVSASVAVGDAVSAGEVIGVLTAAQSHCLPAVCLHWGWIRNADDVYLDPLTLVGLNGPVRLLPLWSAQPVSPSSQAQERVSARMPVPLLPYANWLPLVARLLG